MKNVATTILMMLLTAGSLLAAPGDATWLRTVGNEVQAASDDLGGTVAAAIFYEDVDFGGGPITPTTWSDMAVVRYDATGALDWLTHIVPVNDGGMTIYAVTTDSTGAVYVAGYLWSGGVDFGGGLLSGSGEGFLVKFDATGTHAWSRLCGAFEPASVSAVGGRVAVLGHASGTVNLGGGPIPAGDMAELAAGVLALDGTHVWSALWTGSGDQRCVGGGLDAAGNLTMAVSVGGSVDFGGGLLTAVSTDLGLASFDAAGAYRWADLFTGSFDEWGWITASCDVAADGRAALTGRYSGTVDFGGGPLAGGTGDAFVAVHDGNGTALWSQGLSCPDGAYGQGVSIDANGGVAVSGYAGGDIDCGGGVLTGPGSGDLFLAFFDASGAHVASRLHGGADYDESLNLDHGPSGDLAAWGYCGPGADFGTGPLTDWSLYLGRLEGAGGGSGTAIDAPAPLMTSVGCFPNPFNPVTTVSFTLERAADVSVGVYDPRGRLVRELERGRPYGAGEHRVRFEAEASGTYLVRVRAGDVERTVKVIAIK